MTSDSKCCALMCHDYLQVTHLVKIAFIPHLSKEPTNMSTQNKVITLHKNVPDYVRDETITLSTNSSEVLRRRYLRKGLDGQPVETAVQMFYRVASHVGKAEEEFGGDSEQATKQFYELLTDLRFFPNSPTFTGAGTPLGQLAACFVLPIEDDMGKHPDGIFQTMRNAALIQQTGGGQWL